MNEIIIWRGETNKKQFAGKVTEITNCLLFAKRELSACMVSH